MAIEKYRDFILVADDVEKEEEGVLQFSVEVFASPRGGGLRATKQKISPDLRKELGRLERRKLDVDGIISLGEKLADLLLPSEMRELFKGCLDMLRKGQGLRLRLRLDPALAGIPWEFIYVRRAGGERDSTGFLVLDPRVSIARHEAMPIPGDFDDTPKKRRLLVALASPEDEVPLDLDKERDNLKEALRDVPGIGLDFVENATLQKLGDELIGGADIFHFAGHGTFGQAGAEARYGTAEGEGAILLVAEDGSGAPMPAEELAVNLRGRGVELVVLGACQTGRRGEGNVWSSVAAALMKAGIPAAVAMQYGIWDDAAIAFNRSFYRVLAAGLPLDYAVSAGRLAAFNRCHPVREHLELGKCYRDWGVPVLYLRSEQDFVLPAIKDAGEREAVTRTAKAEAERRERELVEKGVPAPALTGKSFSEAEDLASKAGVVVREKGRRYHSSAPEAAVIEQSPEAGAPVEAGAVIEVVLSKGPEIAPVVVPEVTGKTLKQTEASFDALGLSLKIGGRRYDAEAPAETVIKQSVRSGEPVKLGSTVSVVVSRGPKPARARPIINRKLLFSAAAVAGTAAVLTILALAGVFSTTPKVEVPRVEGGVEAVDRELRRLGFDVEYEAVPSEEVPEGHIIKTEPAAGEEVAEGSVIRLVVSGGPPKPAVQVPSVEGPEESVARKLIAMGFEVESELGESKEVPEGHVIRTHPPAGAEVESGSRVTLLVSGGRPEELVRVPPVKGPEASVTRKLKTMGFKVGSELGKSEEVPEGHVIRTHPRAGAEVERGSRITLLVSAGPPVPSAAELPAAVPIPSVKNKSLAEAKRLLGRFRVETTYKRDKNVAKGYVLGQSVEGDAPAGTTITLTVSKGNVCPECGKENPSGKRYCNECGEEL